MFKDVIENNPFFWTRYLIKQLFAQTGFPYNAYLYTLTDFWLNLFMTMFSWLISQEYFFDLAIKCIGIVLNGTKINSYCIKLHFSFVKISRQVALQLQNLREHSKTKIISIICAHLGLTWVPKCAGVFLMYEIVSFLR